MKWVKSLHSYLIQSGISVMELTLKRYMSTKGLRKIVSKICNNCLICKTEKNDNANYRIPNIFFKTLKVNEMIAVDLKAPILAKYYQNYSRMSEFYILVVVDLYSRYSEIEILKK
ncbi:hypothetical protein DMUE_1524 [Dictyocoela muelleri]|nr:hypothetical protein DMUE_1524 [Dictyocoela muelleri]